MRRLRQLVNSAVWQLSRNAAEPVHQAGACRAWKLLGERGKTDLAWRAGPITPGSRSSVRCEKGPSDEKRPLPCRGSDGGQSA